MTTNPAVVADCDFAGVLDVVSSRLNLGLVSGGEYADEGAEHDTVAYGHDTTVKYDSTVNVRKLQKARGS